MDFCRRVKSINVILATNAARVMMLNAFPLRVISLTELENCHDRLRSLIVPLFNALLLHAIATPLPAALLAPVDSGTSSWVSLTDGNPKADIGNTIEDRYKYVWSD